jgi:hypothetical protein
MTDEEIFQRISTIKDEDGWRKLYKDVFGENVPESSETSFGFAPIEQIIDAVTYKQPIKRPDDEPISATY